MIASVVRKYMSCNSVMFMQCLSVAVRFGEHCANVRVCKIPSKIFFVHAFIQSHKKVSCAYFFFSFFIQKSPENRDYFRGSSISLLRKGTSYRPRRSMRRSSLEISLYLSLFSERRSLDRVSDFSFRYLESLSLR